MEQNTKKEERERENQRKVDALIRFLGVIFGKEDYMSEVDAKECLYYVKYIKSCIDACLNAQSICQIPILECTIWARHDGKTEVTINPNKNPEIRDSWFLSELTHRLMEAINKWDKKDIGQKQSKVIDMMSQLGWVRDIGTAG